MFYLWYCVKNADGSWSSWGLMAEYRSRGARTALLNKYRRSAALSGQAMRFKVLDVPYSVPSHELGTEVVE
jgi:hypothetical protein